MVTIEASWVAGQRRQWPVAGAKAAHARASDGVDGGAKSSDRRAQRPTYTRVALRVRSRCVPDYPYAVWRQHSGQPARSRAANAIPVSGSPTSKGWLAPGNGLTRSAALRVGQSCRTRRSRGHRYGRRCPDDGRLAHRAPSLGVLERRLSRGRHPSHGLPHLCSQLTAQQSLCTGCLSAYKRLTAHRNCPSPRPHILLIGPIPKPVIPHPGARISRLHPPAYICRSPVYQIRA